MAILQKIFKIYPEETSSDGSIEVRTNCDDMIELRTEGNWYGKNLIIFSAEDAEQLINSLTILVEDLKETGQ